MITNITDAEVHVLASIATVLKTEYVREGIADPWAGSPFAWVRTMPSRRVGKIGEQLVSGWCAAKGLDVLRSPDSEADRIIGSRRVEIKFSTLWESGTYTFQQFRNQNYEYAICLGISPFDAHCWVLPQRTHTYPRCTSTCRKGRVGYFLDNVPATESTALDGAHGWHLISSFPTIAKPKYRTSLAGARS